MIELKNLSKKYEDKIVFEHLSLNINEGEFLVVLGPSGCGKTTLLRTIAGLETINEGDILFNNESVVYKTPKERKISMVFQNYALFPDMNVKKNISFGLKIQKLQKVEIDKRVDEVAKALKIFDLLKRKPNQLSGGEQQRVAIARAIVKEPLVYLFDEPLSNLDVNLKADSVEMFKDIHSKTKGTFIYVTHSQSEALKLADRIVLIDDGKIIQVDNPKDLYNRPKNLFAANFIGEPKINIINSKKENVKFGIRPEKIKLTQDTNHELILQGKVYDKEFLGSGTLLKVNANNISLNVLTLNDINETNVKLYINKNDILVYQDDNLIECNLDALQVTNNQIELNGEKYE